LNLSPHGILSVGKNERTNGRRVISGKYSSACSFNGTFSSQLPPRKCREGRAVMILPKNTARLATARLPKQLDQTTLIHDDGLLSPAGFTL
jgi:hypothetical protein